MLTSPATEKLRGVILNEKKPSLRELAKKAGLSPGITSASLVVVNLRKLLDY